MTPSVGVGKLGSTTVMQHSNAAHPPCNKPWKWLTLTVIFCWWCSAALLQHSNNQTTWTFACRSASNCCRELLATVAESLVHTDSSHWQTYSDSVIRALACRFTRRQSLGTGSGLREMDLYIAMACCFLCRSLTFLGNVMDRSKSSICIPKEG